MNTYMVGDFKTKTHEKKNENENESVSHACVLIHTLRNSLLILISCKYSLMHDTLSIGLCERRASLLPEHHFK